MLSRMAQVIGDVAVTIQFREFLMSMMHLRDLRRESGCDENPNLLMLKDREGTGRAPAMAHEIPHGASLNRNLDPLGPSAIAFQITRCLSHAWLTVDK